MTRYIWLTVFGLLCAGTGLFWIFCCLLNIAPQLPGPIIVFCAKTSPGLALLIFGAGLLWCRRKEGRDKKLVLKKHEEDTSATLLSLSEKLKNCKKNYNAVIEQSFDAIYIIDYNGNFIDANSRICRMTGYTREELMKLNITDLIDPEQLKTDPFFPYDSRFDDGFIRERRIIGKNGNKIDIEIHAKKLEDDRVLVMAHDIGKQKELESSLHQAEVRFQALAEKSSVGVYVIQTERLTYINARFAEIFGYETYELLNLPHSFIDLIIAGEYRPIVRKNIRDRYLGVKDYVNYEVTGLRKDGVQVRVEFSGGRVVIDGEPTIIGTMIDITDRWKAEELLKQSQANLQTILDTADIAYALFDRDLRATAFNEKAVKFASEQYHHQLKTDEPLTDYFPPDKIPEFSERVGEVLNGITVSRELEFPQADGSNVWYFVRLFPVTNEDKEVFGVMFALANITERKIAEDNLHTAYRRIQKHINSIKDMAWKQSHLIRSPLANLKGLVGLLQEDPSDTIVLKKINSELDRLDKIIIEMAEDAADHD